MQYHYIVHPRDGRCRSGDAVFVLHEPLFTRFLVVDSHGDHIDVIETLERDINEVTRKTISQAMKTLDEKLKGTPGAEIGIMDIYPSKMHWSCVGDVDIKSNTRIVPQKTKGLVGDSMGMFCTQEQEIYQGDVFIVHSKGISDDIDAHDFDLSLNAMDLAKSIMGRYRDKYNDSTILVVKI